MLRVAFISCVFPPGKIPQIMFVEEMFQGFVNDERKFTMKRG